jgi:hypothetical protein
MEEILAIHKNEIVFYDEENNCHYRMSAHNIKKITFDHTILKRFFGLKKELIEIIIFDIEDENDEIPEQLIVYEHLAPGFRRYLGALRTFVEDNKVDLEIKRLDGPGV